MDPLDPMYDEWPEEELHAALLEHLSSQSPRALTPSPSNVVEEGRLLHVILEAHVADEDDYTDDDSICNTSILRSIATSSPTPYRHN